MNTFTANIVVLTATVDEQNITGDAITTSGIALKYAVKNNEVNQSIFLPESQLVVSGTMRIHSQLATMGVRITNILATVSVPAAPIEAPSVPAITATPAEDLNLDPAHLQTLKVEELKAIAAELGVVATKNKKAEWIDAILATASTPAKVVEAEIITEGEPVPF
jgi:hypothetical protein